MNQSISGNFRTPPKNSDAYGICKRLVVVGSMSIEEALKMFGRLGRMDYKRGVIEIWLARGCLVNTDGQLSLSKRAEKYFGDAASCEPEIGQVTPSRLIPNVYERPPLSAKYFLKPQGSRDDQPDWSRRDLPSFKSIVSDIPYQKMQGEVVR